LFHDFLINSDSISIGSIYRDKQNSSNIQIMNIVPDDERRSSHILQVSELAQVIAMRAQQISNGMSFSDLESHDPIALAKDEVKTNRCPLKIRRKVGPHTYEIWKINELVKPSELF